MRAPTGADSTGSTHDRQRRRRPSPSAPPTCATFPCGRLGTCQCLARTKTVATKKTKGGSVVRFFDANWPGGVGES